MFSSYIKDRNFSYKYVQGKHYYCKVSSRFNSATYVSVHVITYANVQTHSLLNIKLIQSSINYDSTFDYALDNFTDRALVLRVHVLL